MFKFIYKLFPRYKTVEIINTKISYEYIVSNNFFYFRQKGSREDVEVTIFLLIDERSNQRSYKIQTSDTFLDKHFEATSEYKNHVLPWLFPDAKITNQT